jgi:glycosyltransferase involved in cell wall biosynthesis
MNILFVCHNGLSTNSGIHVSNLATAISGVGADVAVAVPDGEDDSEPAVSAFRLVSYSAAMGLRFEDGLGAELIHAWTPRQHVARITRILSAAHGCPYAVHLEDNEHAITAAHLGQSIDELRARVAHNPHLDVPERLAQPTDMQAFLEGSVGVTVLMDRLLEFKPAHLPGLEIWPAAENELFFPQPKDPNLRAELGINDRSKIVVYNGNVHPANVSEVRSLYLAIGALARSGMDIVLVRLGKDYVSVLPKELEGIARLVIAVPFQPRERVARYLALADVLIQPGRLDDFNAYRFPSKLPEFFALGRPVILPATNVGLKVDPANEALVLYRGDALEMAGRIVEVISDEKLSARLSQGGRKFYDRMLDWKKSAVALRQFYRQLSSQPRLDDLKSDAGLGRVAKHYADYQVPEMLGYATVRDYSDSVERLRALATINQDLKDAQRPWVLKAILGAIPRGARLLEIGAGDPWVADLLARLGYQVVIVDPYDGRDRGPAEFEQIRKQFPQITFLKGLFPEALSALSDAKFDCIYSISVLEHLPMESVSTVFAGIASHTRTRSAPTIHAIDHVLLGDGAEEHFTKLRRMVGCLGLDETDLRATLDRLRDDPDAYFLSAEAHNRWRGATPYDKFPMRRCVSIQLCAPAGGL